MQNINCKYRANNLCVHPTKARATCILIRRPSPITPVIRDCVDRVENIKPPPPPPPPAIKQEDNTTIVKINFTEKVEPNGEYICRNANCGLAGKSTTLFRCGKCDIEITRNLRPDRTAHVPMPTVTKDTNR